MTGAGFEFGFDGRGFAFYEFGDQFVDHVEFDRGDLVE